MNILLWTLLLFAPKPDTDYITKIASPAKITMHHSSNGQLIGSLEKLNEMDHSINFAMNGGMFMSDYSPCGLFVEKGKVKNCLKIAKSSHYNFGMQPQGIFAITKDGKAVIEDATNPHIETYQYATQSAPILVIDGKVNPKLTKSNSRYGRNGVGIMKDGRVLMAVSKDLVTFQEFAKFFISQGCVTAMYLDGAVSDYWMPGRETMGGRGKVFGAMIAVHN